MVKNCYLGTTPLLGVNHGFIKSELKVETYARVSISSIDLKVVIRPQNHYENRHNIHIILLEISCFWKSELVLVIDFDLGFFFHTKTEYSVILVHFLPFSPFRHVYHEWNHWMYDSHKIKHDEDSSLSFWPIFPLLPHWQPKNHTHVKQVGHSPFLLSIYCWIWTTTTKKLLKLVNRKFKYFNIF